MSFNNEAFNQQAINIALLNLSQAQREGLNLAKSQSNEIAPTSDNVVFGHKRIADLEEALRSANELVLDWQASMEAWRDLAKTLREEIKACPNHEAHAFGKDLNAINYKFNNQEDSSRAIKGLQTKYTPEQKGI
jgi:hypothetical protein